MADIRCRVCGQEAYHPLHVPGQNKNHNFEPMMDGEFVHPKQFKQSYASADKPFIAEASGQPVALGRETTEEERKVTFRRVMMKAFDENTQPGDFLKWEAAPAPPVTNEEWSAQQVLDRAAELADLLDDKLAVIGRDINMLGEIRATLLMNFGDTPHNKYGFKVNPKDSTYRMLIHVLECLITSRERVKLDEREACAKEIEGVATNIDNTADASYLASLIRSRTA